MKKVIASLLFMFMFVGSIGFNAYALEDDKTFTVAATVTEKFSFATWVKRMSGPQDPGDANQGSAYPFDDLNFGTLVWEDGRCKAANGRWYAIFFGMDANKDTGYELYVEATDIASASSNISDSVMLTADFQEGDVWDPGDGVDPNTVVDDDPYVSTEEIVKNPLANYADATRSVAKIITDESNHFTIYRTTAPKSRIVRCYVSIFDYQDPNNGGVSKAVMDSVGSPLTSADPGDYTGSITFTMVTN